MSLYKRASRSLVPNDVHMTSTDPEPSPPCLTLHVWNLYTYMDIDPPQLIHAYGPTPPARADPPGSIGSDLFCLEPKTLPFLAVFWGKSQGITSKTLAPSTQTEPALFSCFVSTTGIGHRAPPHFGTQRDGCGLGSFADLLSWRFAPDPAGAPGWRGCPERVQRNPPP